MTYKLNREKYTSLSEEEKYKISRKLNHGGFPEDEILQKIAKYTGVNIYTIYEIGG